jgi:hypothetical protein
MYQLLILLTFNDEIILFCFIYKNILEIKSKNKNKKVKNFFLKRT